MTGSEKTAHFAQNMKLRYRQKKRVGHKNWKTFLFVHTNLKPFAYLLTKLKCQRQVFHGERVVRNAALLSLAVFQTRFSQFFRNSVVEQAKL